MPGLHAADGEETEHRAKREETEHRASRWPLVTGVTAAVVVGAILIGLIDLTVDPQVDTALKYRFWMMIGWNGLVGALILVALYRGIDEWRRGHKRATVERWRLIAQNEQVIAMLSTGHHAVKPPTLVPPTLKRYDTTDLTAVALHIRDHYARVGKKQGQAEAELAAAKKDLDAIESGVVDLETVRSLKSIQEKLRPAQPD